MTKTSSIKITFGFPQFKGKNKKKFINSMIDCVSFDDKTQYAGYPKKASLLKNISWRFNNSLVEKYKSLPENKKQSIEKIIHATIQKSAKILSVSETVNIFVFPMLAPFDYLDKKMGYVSGFTAQRNVINIFISPDKFSPMSLKQMIAHEFNHLALFLHHPSLHPEYRLSPATIKDVIIWEGLAENFSELVTGGKSFASKVLSENQAKEVLNKASSDLDKKVNGRNKAYENLFFGMNGQYKLWTGYCIGYFVVKDFLKSNKISWKKIISMNPRDIFDKSFF